MMIRIIRPDEGGATAGELEYEGISSGLVPLAVACYADQEPLSGVLCGSG